MVVAHHQSRKISLVIHFYCRCRRRLLLPRVIINTTPAVISSSPTTSNSIVTGQQRLSNNVRRELARSRKGVVMYVRLYMSVEGTVHVLSTWLQTYTYARGCLHVSV